MDLVPKRDEALEAEHQKQLSTYYGQIFACTHTRTHTQLYITAMFYLFLLYLENEELRKEFAALANEVGDYLEQKAAILANIGLQGGTLEVCSNHTVLLLLVSLPCWVNFYLKHTLD